MRLLETIKIKNRKAYNLRFHLQRMNDSKRALWNDNQEIKLEEKLNIPNDLTQETYKCRIIYDTKIHRIEFVKYRPKIIRSLKIVECKNLDYRFKYENRIALQHLLTQKGECDDILITKEGKIMDTSYANLVFWDGKNWVTPRHPLLKGTQRSLLLEQGKIIEQEIKISGLHRYSSAKLINAMLEFEAPTLDICQIFS